MADMGLDFKAPPKSDREAWQILAVLFENGFSFHGCGCDAGGVIPPRTLREVPEWLERHKVKNKGEALADQFRSCSR
jgi:hypothetical protein